VAPDSPVWVERRVSRVLLGRRVTPACREIGGQRALPERPVRPEVRVCRVQPEVRDCPVLPEVPDRRDRPARLACPA